MEICQWPSHILTHTGIVILSHQRFFELLSFFFQIETPQNYQQQGNTYSSYKHRNVVNVLYWVLPGGQFAGCSKPIEGCISDRELLIASGLPEELDEGDLVEADRGFTNCKDVFGARKARVMTPPSKPKNGAPLSIKQIFEGEVIARSRIHIGMHITYVYT